MGIYDSELKSQANSYRIKHCLMSEERDLDSMKNLENWCKELYQVFANKAGEERPNLDSDVFEGVINNFSLILMSKGQIEQSEKLIVNVINTYADKYKHDGDLAHIAKLLQPLINHSRLHMCNRNTSEFLRIYSQYNCLTDAETLRLADISVSKKSIASHLEFLSFVSLSEKLKFALKRQKYDLLLAMRESLPRELAVTLLFLEGRVIAYLARGEFENAEVIIRQAMRKTNGLVQNIFYYRYFESLLCKGEFVRANSILQDICTLTLESDLGSIQSRSFAMNLIGAAKLSCDDDLVIKTFSQLISAKDELNYGRLLLQQYSDFQSNEHRIELESLLEKTQYIQLRNMIAQCLGESLPNLNSDSYWSNKLMGAVTEVLDQGKCLL